MNVLFNGALAVALLAAAGAGNDIAATVEISFGSSAQANLSMALDQRGSGPGSCRKRAEEAGAGVLPGDESVPADRRATMIRSEPLDDLSGHDAAGRKGTSQVQPGSRIVVRTGHPPGWPVAIRTFARSASAELTMPDGSAR